VRGKGNVLSLQPKAPWPSAHLRWGILRWPQVGDFGWPPGLMLQPKVLATPERFSATIGSD
jgi:hypothetical protein